MLLLPRSTCLLLSLLVFQVTLNDAFQITTSTTTARTNYRLAAAVNGNNDDDTASLSSRRTFFSTTTTAATAVLLGATSGGSPLVPPPPAHAVGPVKVTLNPTSYTAKPCPRDRPIPGQQAMRGMRGLCVTVTADLLETPPKVLEKVGVYGFITDAESGDSVLANNPDLSTDAGQFAMIPVVTTSDKTIQFEFIAAVPMEKELSGFENGIGPLKFESLRIISYPGGQQYGSISPCEMNEFSDECEAWEAENGPYQKAEYMMRGKKKQ